MRVALRFDEHESIELDGEPADVRAVLRMVLIGCFRRLAGRRMTRALPQIVDQLPGDRSQRPPCILYFPKLPDRRRYQRPRGPDHRGRIAYLDALAKLEEAVCGVERVNARVELRLAVVA